METKGDEKIKKYESIPSAKMLLASLRSVGYTDETAIADIIDNSIAANANKICIWFDWDRKQILIADDGDGMSSEELIKAMQIGSSDPNETRNINDLGRFGMGMKTASFSLGKRLLVISKNDGNYCNAVWDLNYIEHNDKWNILIKDETEIEEILNYKKEKIQFQSWDCGTIIIIRDLDRMIDFDNLEKSKGKFYQMISKVKKHISMIFHRFIEEDNLEIYVNGNLINAWNPFIIDNVATQELSMEIYEDEKNTVTIQPYVLPHKTKFEDENTFNRAGGIKGWLNHQGFYVYRNRRLLVYGTWFGKLKKEPAYNLARIKLDMLSESDFNWNIDIKKSKAVPPVVIEELVMQVALLTTQSSAKVYNSRGTYNKSANISNGNLKYIWEQRLNSLGQYMFYLNKKNPLLLNILQQLDDDKAQQLKTYLSLVENYSPAMMCGIVDMNNKSTQKIDDEIKYKDIIRIEEKIKILKKLSYEKEEIYDVINEMPEYSYLLSSDLKKIIDGGNRE
ncbi:ATP-binding protein [Clostridium chromiireducens]|uniref:ATP-binding protein n=1 Tax=Clostridium chromiireducens TaxID=225345 RepID=A0A399IIW7_9CLOT|nr:ATP-binding protein [Clostridium chromiireducens]RII32953.1 ATP-binding protein [Clostridium chromiireducens]